MRSRYFLSVVIVGLFVLFSLASSDDISPYYSTIGADIYFVPVEGNFVAKVSARVLDNNQKPVAGATVKFFSCRGENIDKIIPSSSMTDSDGPT